MKRISTFHERGGLVSGDGAATATAVTSTGASAQQAKTSAMEVATKAILAVTCTPTFPLTSVQAHLSLFPLSSWARAPPLSDT